MFNRKENYLTETARFFLEPQNTTHRQYEALRAYFVDGLQSAEAAAKFGYSPGSFRVLCHDFRQDPSRKFFLDSHRISEKPEKIPPSKQRVIELRKKNLSIYEISAALKEEGIKLSPPAVGIVLQEEGFERLPRRKDDERPYWLRPEAAEVADARKIDLSPRQFQTKFGGVFLFLPFLAGISLDQLLISTHFPGSQSVSAGHAIRSLLGLKLFGNARHSHVMSHVFDEGLALFAGLNTIPKRSFLTEYSCRIQPSSYPKLMSDWFDAIRNLGLEFGASFDVDFHTIPFHGEDALVEKHYISKRSRRQKGILSFVAQDAETRVFCYGNSDLREQDRPEEILRFAEFWKERTTRYPEELIFDSQLTTYSILNELNKKGIAFITLRRRSKKMMEEIFRKPGSVWRKITLDNIARSYRTPRILDEKVNLKDYEGPIRQISVTDLGHELPTVVLTNQLQRSPAKIVGRYAQRMVIENGIADGIDFFHMDALSSAVAMKVNCDLQLTLMASSLYRLLGALIGGEYQTAKSRRIFRDFIDTTANVRITETDIFVRLGKRAHNPLLLKAGFDKLTVKVPWWNGKNLRFAIG